MTAQESAPHAWQLTTTDELRARMAALPASEPNLQPDRALDARPLTARLSSLAGAAATEKPRAAAAFWPWRAAGT
jgi:hypothetical protein